MSTVIIKANQPVIILPDTHYLVTPEFSISPLHAKALSNIYSSITTELFTPRDPEWTTSPLSPSICAERGKRHYHRANVPRYRSSREVNMGAHYTTDRKGLLPGERLQSSRQEEIWIQNSPSLYPQSGDLLLEGKTKRTKAASSSFSSRPVQKKPILKGGLAQEINLIFYDTKVIKDDFPAPFCDLPDHTFVQWVVRNMEILGVGAWEAECEAMDVLWRTKEKKKNVENETVEEDGQGASVMENECKDTHQIVEMRLRLNAIQMRRIEKRKRKTNVFWMWRSLKQYYEEVRSVEELNLHTTECRVKRWHLARIKRCFRQK
ncbi:hypothetical protein GT037_008259 [Alternaria burnsii]|uniref:Uncharacterized protein n=1 Tax=Alternaria burnsii TaxID=1187904 RepID=A0A8H7ED33_9PLEO|nr:uncharacterized protein GT037_008259 [Alternaria burnsii]KAF7673644.1 hypothetical protein GT037_008259 [Alternaria burnsii]